MKVAGPPSAVEEPPDWPLDMMDPERRAAMMPKFMACLPLRRDAVEMVEHYWELTCWR